MGHSKKTAKKKPTARIPAQLYRHDAGNARLLNRAWYTLDVDQPVQDVIPVVTLGGNLHTVNYDQADEGVVLFCFSDPMTRVRAVLWTVKP